MQLDVDTFYSMSLQEFYWRAEGHRITDARRQEPFRLLYFVLHNANAKKPKSYHQIMQEWPLYTDGNDQRSEPNIEMMNEAWERLKNLDHGADRSQIHPGK